MTKDDKVCQGGENARPSTHVLCLGRLALSGTIGMKVRQLPGSITEVQNRLKCGGQHATTVLWDLGPGRIRYRCFRKIKREERAR
jgi:hypothetical protein